MGIFRRREERACFRAGRLRAVHVAVCVCCSFPFSAFVSLRCFSVAAALCLFRSLKKLLRSTDASKTIETPTAAYFNSLIQDISNVNYPAISAIKSTLSAGGPCPKSLFQLSAGGWSREAPIQDTSYCLPLTAFECLCLGPLQFGTPPAAAASRSPLHRCTAQGTSRARSWGRSQRSSRWLAGSGPFSSRGDGSQYRHRQAADALAPILFWCRTHERHRRG